MKTIPSGPFLGINNRLPDFALATDKGRWLREAENVDIDNAGRVRRRAAAALVQAMSNADSLYMTSATAGYLRRGAAIYATTLPTYSETLFKVLSADAPVSWTTYGSAIGTATAVSSGVTVVSSGVVAPTNTVAPVISGALAFGSVLTSTTGTWTGTPTITYAYQWRADGTNISGETASTYTTLVGDVGKSITCRVTATNSAGSASANSNARVPEAAAFSPLSLFASSEEGAWYDPSDLTTMFQDRAGTRPVTADGQTVGLILDKRKGLVLGSESCPTFTDSGWDDAGAIPAGWVLSGGILTVTASAQWARAASTLSQNALNKWFVCSIDVQSISGSVSVSAWLGWTGGVSTDRSISITTTGIKSFYFYSNDAASGVDIQVTSAGASFVFNSISVKEVAGNHAVAPSDAARPLKTYTGLSGWINYDAVDDVLNSTFPSSLGSSCTVCRANVGAAPTILTVQTIGTSYADSTDHAGLIIINRALTGQETTDVTAWLLAKGAT